MNDHVSHSTADAITVRPVAPSDRDRWALLYRQYAEFYQRGWSLVRWITASDNEPARRLYDDMAQATAWITYDLKPTRA